MTEPNEQERLLYGDLTARIRRMLETAAHDSFLFHEDTIALLEPMIPAGSKVLDAGCGRGTLTLWLAERGCNVVAIDPSEERLAHTRELVREKKLDQRVRLESSHLPDAFPEDILMLFWIVFPCGTYPTGEALFQPLLRRI